VPPWPPLRTASATNHQIFRLAEGISPSSSSCKSVHQNRHNMTTGGVIFGQWNMMQMMQK